MTLKGDTNFIKKLTHGWKNDVTNFYEGRKKSENLQIDGLLLPKVYND